MRDQDDPDPPASAGPPSLRPSARNISLDLHRLAQQAGDLGLQATHAAIRHAIDVCREEIATAGARPAAHLN